LPTLDIGIHRIEPALLLFELVVHITGNPRVSSQVFEGHTGEEERVRKRYLA
jgi:hypothetical protein